MICKNKEKCFQRYHAVSQIFDGLYKNKNHFVNFTGATFVLATHVEGSFSSTSL